MEKKLIKYLRDMAGKACLISVRKDLDNLIRDGELTSQQKEKVLESSNFKVFGDMIELLYTKYSKCEDIKDLGGRIALHFSVVFEVEDILEEWKTEYLFPLIGKIKGE